MARCGDVRCRPCALEEPSALRPKAIPNENGMDRRLPTSGDGSTAKLGYDTFRALTPGRKPIGSCGDKHPSRSVHLGGSLGSVVSCQELFATANSNIFVMNDRDTNVVPTKHFQCSTTRGV